MPNMFDVVSKCEVEFEFDCLLGSMVLAYLCHVVLWFNTICFSFWMYMNSFNEIFIFMVYRNNLRIVKTHN